MSKTEIDDLSSTSKNLNHLIFETVQNIKLLQIVKFYLWSLSHLKLAIFQRRTKLKMFTSSSLSQTNSKVNELLS